MGNLEKTSGSKRATQAVPLPYVSSIDKRLGEIIEELEAYHYHEGDFRDKPKPKTLEAIKRAFTDEGYMKPDDAYRFVHGGGELKTTPGLSQRLPQAVSKDKPSKNATRKERQNHGE